MCDIPQTVKYCTAIQNAILPFVTTCKDLEGIMLSEVIQINSNQILLDLHAESKKQNNQTKPKTDSDTENKQVNVRRRHWGG